MAENKDILIIGTYDIDIFYRVADHMAKQGCDVKQASTSLAALDFVKRQPFHAILINLEPDGKGGVAGIDLLQAIMDSSFQKHAVCLGVSTQSPTALLVSGPEKLKQLSVLAGWLTLPIQAEKATKMILSITDDPGKLSVESRVAGL